MGTSLTGLTPATTYDALIKVGDNGPLSATAKVLSDGLGNDSVLALSTSNVGIGTTNANRLLVVQQNSTNTYNAADPTTFNQIQAVRNTTSGTGYNSFLAFASEPNGEWYLGSINKSNFSDFVIVGRDATYGERMRITSAGNVGIGTSSPVGKLQVNGGDLRVFNVGTQLVLGSGIAGSYEIGVTTGNRMDFSLSGVGTYLSILSTGGITFNGDTAAANALDDYEEGTFTPVLSDGTNNATMDANTLGFYTKIGRVVYCSFTVSTSSLGSVSGNIEVKGLPFLQGVTFGPSTFTTSANQLLNVSLGQFVSGRLLGAATSIHLWINNSTAGMTRMQATEWSPDGYANFTGYYFV